MATKEELEQQLHTARKDIETLTAMAGQTAREQVHNGADKAQAHMAQLSDETRALFDKAQKQGVQLRQATEDGVRNHPLATIGVAFAAGLVFANVVGRR